GQAGGKQEDPLKAVLKRLDAMDETLKSNFKEVAKDIDDLRAKGLKFKADAQTALEKIATLEEQGAKLQQEGEALRRGRTERHALNLPPHLRSAPHRSPTSPD